MIFDAHYTLTSVDVFRGATVSPKAHRDDDEILP